MPVLKLIIKYIHYKKISLNQCRQAGVMHRHMDHSFGITPIWQHSHGMAVRPHRTSAPGFTSTNFFTTNNYWPLPHKCHMWGTTNINLNAMSSINLRGESLPYTWLNLNLNIRNTHKSIIIVQLLVE